MMHITRLIIILLLCSLSLSALAGKKVHQLYLENNRWTDYAHAALRDNEGYLWIGTDDGLKRYDGYSIHAFSHNPDDRETIGQGAIRIIREQSDGTVWSAGYSLNRFNRLTQTFTRYAISNFMTITSLVEDAQGFLWIGGEGFGLLRFDPRSGTVTDKLFTDRAEGII